MGQRASQPISGIYPPIPFPQVIIADRAERSRRGMCNCIQMTILLGPPAEGRPGPSDDYYDDCGDDDDDDGQGDLVQCQGV